MEIAQAFRESPLVAPPALERRKPGLRMAARKKTRGHHCTARRKSPRGARILDCIVVQTSHQLATALQSVSLELQEIRCKAWHACATNDHAIPRISRPNSCKPACHPTTHAPA